MSRKKCHVSGCRRLAGDVCCLRCLIDHRRRHNVVRTSVTHSATPRVPLFCSYHILTSSVIYYWTDARQRAICLLNICSEWRPGILRTKRHYQTHFTHVINTGNVQQDGEEETQIYLPDDGIRILKTKRHETFYRTKFIHGIKPTCCTCEFFNKLKLHSPGSVRISAFRKTHSRKLITN